MALSLGGLALFVAPACAPRDGDVVYCLSEDQRPHLAEAAVTLGLVARGSVPDQMQVDGQKLPLDMWRVQRERDFKRSCSALVASARSPSSGAAASGLVATVNVLVGALIGFLSARYQDHIVRARQQARELHATNRAFVAAAESYLRKWNDGPTERPSDQTLLERRSDLAAELRWVQAMRPRWTVPGQIQSVLAGNLGEQMSTGWDPVDPASRARKASDLQDKLHALAPAINEVGRALERPFLPHPEMRKQVQHQHQGAGS